MSINQIVKLSILSILLGVISACSGTADGVSDLNLNIDSSNISNNSLSLNTAILNTGNTDTPYNETLIGSGGVPPYRWTINNGTLPAGLSLNTSTGALSGVPTTKGTSSFNVSLIDAENTQISKNLSISITSTNNIQITTSSLNTGISSSPYSVTLSTSGGTAPYIWSISTGSLPTGLTLNTNTGEVSGTPTNNGNFDFTVLLTDNSGNQTSKNLNIIVLASIQASTVNSIMPGEIWKYFKGTEPASSNWNNNNFDDSQWLSDLSGFGYADNDDNTILDDMKNNYLSVYTRKEFFHDSTQTSLTSLTLNIDYDDGYIAYLNGVEISRSSNFPTGTINFNTSTITTREAGTAININLDSFINNIVDGVNVIAVQVHNQSINSSDLSLITSLRFNEGSFNGGGGGGGDSGTTGSLINYTNVGSLNTLSYIANDLSGVTYVAESDTYFMIQNNGGRIWEVDNQFNLIRTITMSNGFGDTEDIVDMGNGEFAIVNEAHKLFIVKIDMNTTTLSVTDTINVQTITFGGDAGNVGPEGVAFDKATSIFYVVKEKRPKAIYSFVRPSTADNVTITPNIPFSAETVLTMANDLSGIVFDTRTSRLLILSQESHLVVDVEINGSILGILKLADSTQHEGITLDLNFDLQITSESNFQRTYGLIP